MTGVMTGVMTGAGTGVVGVLSAVEFAGLLDGSWGSREQEIRFWEELKAVCAGKQARATADLAQQQRDVQRAGGVRERDVGKGIAAQVGLARRESPFRGSRHLGFAEALVGEMPNTLAALESGLVSEWRATLVVRETACLLREDRATVDAELAARPGGLGALGDREVGAEARRIAYRLDPYAVTSRARRAESDRRVSLRPAPDTMTYLTALLPVMQGVAAWKAVTQAADTHRAEGDPRSLGQVMADTLVERLTGQATAAGVPVEVNVVISEDSLFGDSDEPGEVEGYGPVPAPLLRGWLRAQGDGQADGQTNAEGAGEVEMWLRRLYTRPSDGGALVGMDSRRRFFTGAHRRFLMLRDRWCRTPWCDAPIRHADHPVAVAEGGRTRWENGQGLCEACNYAKEAAGWRTRLLDGPGDDGAVETTTPTGLTYTSRPPPPVGSSPPTREHAPSVSRMELYFRDLVLAS